MRRFDPDPRLHHLILKTKAIPEVALFLCQNESPASQLICDSDAMTSTPHITTCVRHSNDCKYASDKL